MLIVDDAIDASSGDKVERIFHKPVKDRDVERALYVRPLPREKDAPNMREIAGNKAYEYITGKRYYDLTNKEEKPSITEKTIPIVTVSFIGAIVLILGYIIFNQVKN